MPQNPPRKIPRANPKKKKGEISNWDSLEIFLEKREKPIVILICLLFAFFGIAFFDICISIGGDDATYIERGFNFIRHGEITFYQGPLYPIILGLFIGIFGINLVVLKSLSFVCMLGMEVLTFLALRKRIPRLILFFLLFFIATNYFIQYYSSQTYTEATFLFLQALALYFVFRLIDAEEQETGWKSNLKLWMIVGLMMLLLSLCKSIAIVCFLPLIFYFLLKRRWRSALKAFLAFFSWKLVYEIGMRVLYRAPDMGQFKQILQKDLYSPEAGYETIPGLLERFFKNLNTFFSMNLLRFLSIQDKMNETSSPVLAGLVAVVLIAITIYLFRKNKYLFFIALYALVFYGGIFIGIQASNRQARLIIIALPLTYFMLLSAGYYLSRSYSRLAIVITLSTVFVLFVQLANALEVAHRHMPLLKKNLQGDMYFGYTPDWVNYLKLSRWCADNLPDTALVACRKGAMSFIYGHGKHFYEINQAATYPDPDSSLAVLKKAGVTHFIIAKLRRNEKVNDGEFINTVHRVFVPIQEKYPNKLKYLMTMGSEEEASLYEIDY